MDEKLQKVIARAGFGSRREIEGWITAGRIKVNGKVAALGDRVTDKDRVQVDGKTLAPRKDSRKSRRVLLYNKPEAEICTRKDPEGRPTVFDRLPRLKHGRWVSVGRLDINTSGLLLFTTDGDFANALMHPSAAIDREYAVRVMGEVSPEMINNMLQGVTIDDHPCRFTDLKLFRGGSSGPGPEKRKGTDEGVNKWYHVTLIEGRNREVRKLWESQGLRVSRLKRVRFGPCFIPSRVRRGQFYELTEKEIELLGQALDAPAEKPTRRKPTRR